MPLGFHFYIVRTKKRDLGEKRCHFCIYIQYLSYSNEFETRKELYNRSIKTKNATSLSKPKRLCYYPIFYRTSFWASRSSNITRKINIVFKLIWWEKARSTSKRKTGTYNAYRCRCFAFSVLLRYNLLFLVTSRFFFFRAR